MLDIGCGSLRVGRLLIPYLDPGNYIGVEPNKRMLWEGVKYETGKDLIRIKKPVFSSSTYIKQFTKPLELDYAVAQSIFSHCSKEIIDGWLGEVSMHLKDTGALLANFGHGQADYAGTKWVYPGCVRFRSETMSELAEKHGLRFEMLNWYHPVLTWALFSRPGYDRSFVEGGDISWNRMGQSLEAKRRSGLHGSAQG